MVIQLTTRGRRGGEPEMQTSTINKDDFAKPKYKRKNRPPDPLKKKRKRAKRKKGK